MKVGRDITPCLREKRSGCGAERAWPGGGLRGFSPSDALAGWLLKGGVVDAVLDRAAVALARARAGGDEGLERSSPASASTAMAVSVRP